MKFFFPFAPFCQRQDMNKEKFHTYSKEAFGFFPFSERGFAWKKKKKDFVWKKMKI
jgi:hypothetical protein